MNNFPFLLIFGILFISSGFAVSDAFGAGYIKFEGIEGESTDDGHKDWINLLSFGDNFKIYTSLSTRTQNEISDISIVKELDKSSPKLAESLAKGKIFPKVEIHVDSGERTYYAYELTNVIITSYSISGSENQVPTEEISLNFERITIEEQTKEVPISVPEIEDEIVIEVETKVPSWVQTTAQFWIDGNVSDREFTDGIGYLVKEKIIDLDEKVESSGEEPSESKVPSWIKESTKWWIDGQVPEDQFLESIKWLIKNNIIVVPLEAPEGEVKFKMSMGTN